MNLKEMLESFLNKIESYGNRLPHPTSLFVFLCLLIPLLSLLLGSLGIQAIHPISGETIKVVNLLNGENIGRMLSKAVTNFTGFAPVGTVLVAMLGIGIAEKSGLMGAALQRLIRIAPSSLMTPTVVLAGVLSSMAADAGYVVLIPLAAAVFLAAGRHPLAGIAAAFAGVSGGFSANLMVGPVDAILAGISTEAAHIIDPTYQVNPAANYYFMLASTLLITLLGTWVTEKVVSPRLGVYEKSNQKNNPKYNHHDNQNQRKEYEYIAAFQTKALTFSVLTGLIYGAMIFFMVYPEDAILRDPITLSILRSPFMSGLIVIISLGFALMGLVYGWVSHSFKSDKDVILAMEFSMVSMAGYIVLMFFAAQFIAYFSWSQIGVVLSIELAGFLESLALPPAIILICFIFLTAGLNLLIGSASAKWALMAPIFVPVFMLLGLSPELAQASYRIADSSTNIITPLMPYFGVVIAFVQRYVPNAGLGTLSALMIPYAVLFCIIWTILLLAWYMLGLPLGPDIGFVNKF